jgi:hypothetical protein
MQVQGAKRKVKVQGAGNGLGYTMVGEGCNEGPAATGRKRFLIGCYFESPQGRILKRSAKSKQVCQSHAPRPTIASSIVVGRTTGSP